MGGEAMLSKKYRDVLESIAEELQKSIGVKNLNDYDVDNILDFVKDSGCVIKFENGDKTTYVPENHTIEFDFKKEDYTVDDNKKKFFWGIWNFLSDKLELTKEKENEVFDTRTFSTSIIGMSADYFARAMIMPKETFLHNVIQETDAEEKINVFSLATKYNVEYTEVIARCRELDVIGFV